MSTRGSPPAHLDLLVRGAIALTAETDRPVIEDAVIGIRGDRLVVVASAAEVGSAASADRVIDASGYVVTPGFVNVHTHTVLCMVRGVADDMGFAPAYTPGVPHGHDVTPEEARALARLGALEAMLFGSTLINDTYVHADVTLPAMGELGLRVFAGGRIHDVEFSGVHRHVWEHRPEIGERTLADAVALAQRWHGKMAGRLGVQLAAHAPDTCSRGLLAEIDAARRSLGLRANIHLAQSRVEVARVKERDGMTPAELLDEIGLLDDRLLGAHCLFLTDDDIARVGRARTTVCHVPKGNAEGGTAAPTSRLRRAGAAVALATDNMHADMVEVMRWALAIGRIQEGAVTDFWQPRHVFLMGTLEGARAMGLDGETGSLKPGKKADLVGFDFRRAHLTPNTNPLGNLVHVAQGRDVNFVIIDGRVVVDGGRPTLVDEEAIRREAALAARQLWARV
ncbi:MAG: amidohydrolase family protein [Candidatus Rokuibacteriota bacterium]